LKNVASKDDHQRTLARLDESLEWARSRGRTRLVELLNLIRIEILFDMGLSEEPPLARNRAAAAGSAFGANRSV